MQFEKHNYHLVDPSPWPAIGAFGVIILAFGAISYFGEGLTFGAEETKRGSMLPMLIGLGIVLFTMAGWWRDVVKESHSGVHNEIVQIGLKYGMVLFIASEVCFFVAFFWAFFDVSLPGQADYREAIGGVWPPEGVETMHAMGIPLLNTIILLSSGATLTWAHHGLRQNNRKQLIYGLILTLALGWTFTALQGYEYYVAKFAITEGIYPSTFFMATGFHGFHVIVGSLFLLVCLIRSIKGHFTPNHHVGFEAAAWYWHFVDVVWIFLFTVVYWWGTQ
jgi:cytochrome c oxidase subunit 3